jgi:hypothetical protein
MSAPRKRALSAKPALAVRPLTVTPDTAFTILGITPRVFRERLVPHCRDVAYVTPRTPLVPLDEVERVLRDLAVRDGAVAAANDDDRDDEPMTADAVLARLGRRRVVGAGFAHRDHPFRAIVTGRSGPS